jgi:hypothetical protein
LGFVQPRDVRLQLLQQLLAKAPRKNHDVHVWLRLLGLQVTRLCYCFREGAVLAKSKPLELRTILGSALHSPQLGCLPARSLQQS